MAETTGIAWTNSTWNPWEGCTRVGEGCRFCYAEARDKRFHEGAHWGPGAPRRRMAEATFRKPIFWNRYRVRYDGMLKGDRFVPPGTKVPPLWVFTLSLGDFFDNEVDPAWRADAWAIIRACTSLRFQIVTKRVGNVPKMLPADWGDGSAYSHVGILATTVDQDELLRDAPKLVGLKDLGVRWVGLSIEPQLDLVDLLALRDVKRLDWVITGGESQQGQSHTPRPYLITWADLLIRDCAMLGIACFVKQLGDNPRVLSQGSLIPFTTRNGQRLMHAGGDPDQWPKNLRVRQMPRVYDAQR